MKSKNQQKVSSSALAYLWKALVADLFDSYRPERHYMRGPGPKWREKHLPGAPRGPMPLVEPVEARA